MTFEPIIKAKLDKFRNDYNIKGTEDTVFEIYVNYLLLEMLYPGVNDTDDDLLNQVCVGGNGDMGLDGIIIFANDRPIHSITDIDDISETSRKIDFQIVFIQSKNKNGFKHDEFQVFLAGVEDFLRENITMPANDKVKYWHEIYRHISSKEILLKQSKKPTISIYYITTGKWEEQTYIVSDFDRFKEHVASFNSFEEPHPYYIDSKKLLDLVNSNDNYYETVVKYVESIDLPEVQGTKKSVVALCAAEEIVTLITTQDGILRRNIFDDNVRDYQGNTDINHEITETLKNRPEQFQLLNNGITVVCEDLELGNRQIKLNSPQVVNGCQTCNVLYFCSRAGIDISRAMAVVKFISSDDSEIINSIVRGTNRQNIVYEEAFEITRDFHKSIEKFFNSYVVGDFPRLYYERRSKQYENDPSIMPAQKINFRILIQCGVGLVLGKVHDAYMHESRLLKKYSSMVFVDRQSFLPYYMSTFIFKQIDNLIRRRELHSRYKPYIIHISYVLMYISNGKPYSINNEKKSDAYFKKLTDEIGTVEKFEVYAKKACARFDEIVDDWVKEKGESYRSGVKDSSAFTEFMFKSLNNIQMETDTIEASTSKSSLKHRGKILNIGKDIHGKLYGFISKNPHNIFFHVDDNRNISEEYKGKDVIYDISEDGKRAVNIRLV